MICQAAVKGRCVDPEHVLVRLAAVEASQGINLGQTAMCRGRPQPEASGANAVLPKEGRGLRRTHSFHQLTCLARSSVCGLGSLDASQEARSLSFGYADTLHRKLVQPLHCRLRGGTLFIEDRTKSTATSSAGV